MNGLLHLGRRSNEFVSIDETGVNDRLPELSQGMLHSPEQDLFNLVPGFLQVVERHRSLDGIHPVPFADLRQHRDVSEVTPTASADGPTLFGVDPAVLRMRLHVEVPELLGLPKPFSIVYDPSFDVIDVMPFRDRHGKDGIAIGKNYQDGKGGILKKNSEGNYILSESFDSDSSNPETLIQDDFAAQSFEHFSLTGLNGVTDDYIAYSVGDRSTKDVLTNPTATGVWSEIWVYRLGAGTKGACMVSVPQDRVASSAWGNRFTQTEPEVLVKNVDGEDKFFIYYSVGRTIDDLSDSFDSHLRIVELDVPKAAFDARCSHQDIWAAYPL